MNPQGYNDINTRRTAKHKLRNLKKSHFIQIGNELANRIQNLYLRNGIMLQHPWIPCTMAGVKSEMHEIFGCPLLGLW